MRDVWRLVRSPCRLVGDGARFLAAASEAGTEIHMRPVLEVICGGLADTHQRHRSARERAGRLAAIVTRYDKSRENRDGV